MAGINDEDDNELEHEEELGSNVEEHEEELGEEGGEKKKSAKEDDDYEYIEEEPQEKIKVQSTEKRLHKKRRRGGRDRAYVRNLEQQLNEERRKNDEFGQRLSAVEGTATNTTAAHLDSQYSQASQYYNTAKSVHADAVKNGDGAAAAEAMETMIEAREAMSILRQRKEAIKTRPEQFRETRDTTQPPPLNPQVQRHFSRFSRENPWYDPQLRNPESRIAKLIDDTLAAEGYDPRTPDYWEELDSRLRANPKLSSLFEEDEEEDDDMDTKRTARRDDSEVRKKPAPVSQRAQPTTTNTKKKIVISRPRAEAMRQMGLEPGTSEWNKMAKRYSDYDKQRSAR